jgi:RNA polymerase sigma-70 factor (sigma-E family)
MTATKRSSAESPVRTATAIAEELYRAHGLGLLRFALLLTGDRATAEDVLQDAFFGVYRALQRGREPDDVLAYLRASVLNAARTTQRAHARRYALLLRAAQPDPPVWSAEAEVIADEDGRAVLTAVAALPRRQREVLALRYFLDVSEKDIAAMLGISRGTVASATARGLAALARKLKEEL